MSNASIPRAPTSSDMEGKMELDPDEGVIYITLYPYPKNSEPTGQQIVDAVSDLVIMGWDNCPLEFRNDEELDS